MDEGRRFCCFKSGCLVFVGLCGDWGKLLNESCEMTKGMDERMDERIVNERDTRT